MYSSWTRGHGFNFDLVFSNVCLNFEVFFPFKTFNRLNLFFLFINHSGVVLFDEFYISFSKLIFFRRNFSVSPLFCCCIMVTCYVLRTGLQLCLCSVRIGCFLIYTPEQTRLDFSLKIKSQLFRSFLVIINSTTWAISMNYIASRSEMSTTRQCRRG